MGSKGQCVHQETEIAVWVTREASKLWRWEKSAVPPPLDVFMWKDCVQAKLTSPLSLRVLR